MIQIKLQMKVVWQHHTSRKATFESPVWMKMLRRSVKDAGILSGLVYGGRSRNLWERLNFHPPEQSREVSHILPNFIQSWHKQCIAENFLPQRFASESHTSHFWSGSLSFVISHHIASGAWSHRISLFSHVFGLIWASPFPWIIIYVGLGMRIMWQSQTLWVAPGIGSQSETNNNMYHITHTCNT